MSETFSKTVTCSGPVNIAVIKYWGKRDETLNLPCNSSISTTLNQNNVRTMTTIMASTRFEEDRIWINHKEASITEERIQRILLYFRDKASKALNQFPKESDEYLERTLIIRSKLHICSANNFPTSAGLASSASGYATLVYTLNKLFKLPEDLTQIARLGSGSACRSLYGGWVKWEMGQKRNGLDSKAIQLFPKTHWPSLRIIVLIVFLLIKQYCELLIIKVCQQQKNISSTIGMKNTVETSELFKFRIPQIENKIKLMEKAIASRNFQEFANLTMKDSNQFHAVCLDTTPPIFYLNETSKEIIQLVTGYNNYYRKIKVAYTFDAGPNAVLYCTEDTLQEFLALINFFFTSSNLWNEAIGENEIQIDHIVSKISLVPRKYTIDYGFVTTIGDGPLVLEEKNHLLSSQTGFPIHN